MRNVSLSLDAGWEVAERLPAGRDLNLLAGGEKLWIPARVPGYIHDDLVRAGVIADPFSRLAELGARWVDEADWTWRTTFSLTDEQLAACGPTGVHWLVFERLDTIARVFLNGTLLGACENAFVAQRFDATAALRVGNNELRVEIDSALRVGRERAAAYIGDGTSERGRTTYFNFPPRSFVRKPQYMFGWDWGPELVSAGIAGPVTLLTTPAAELLETRLDYTFLDDSTVDIRLSVAVQKYDDRPIWVGAALYASGDNTPNARLDGPPGRYTVTLTISDQEVQRWWPNGAGAQRRYLLNLRIRRPSASPEAPEVLDHRGITLGFRTVELVREPDPDGAGEGMLFRVNGIDTFARGANWIPDHSLPGTISRARLRERLTQARDAGFNLLRVWGGGVYESEDFYDLCDELGLLVWQDFPFACATYPDDLPEFVEAVRTEATAAVRRLRHRACLALWCGGNENAELHQGRWSGADQATRFFGETLILQTLPEVLAAEDPQTPYLPNSPWGDAGEGNVQNENFGDAHYWNVWHAKEPTSNGDWTNYAKSDCRFSSEFGFAGPAGPAAWDSVLAPEDKAIRSVASRWHDKTRKGYETYLGFIGMHFPEPADWDEFLYFGQANQAMAFSFGIEHWRRRKGRCWGTLYWQLNDCWPTHSWATIDSAGEPKLAYWAVKRAYAPLLLSLVRGEAGIEAHLVSEERAPVNGQLTLRLRTFEGANVAEVGGAATVPANAASGALLTLTAEPCADCFVQATFVPESGAPQEAFLLLDEPKNLRLPNPRLHWEVEGDAIVVRAERFAAFVALRFEGLKRQPTLSDSGFHLAPGSQRRIRVTGLPRGTTLAEVAAQLRVRHL